MSIALFKDFHKETNDLITKYYLNGKWKVESKLKAGKDQLYVNPTATNNSVSADVEYKLSQQPVTLKATVVPSDKLASAISKVTATFEGAVKVEVATDLAFAAPEITFEQKTAKYTVNDKLTKENAEAYATFKATDFLLVGAGATYNLSSKALGYAAKVRFFQKGLIADATFDGKTINTGISYPLAVADKKIATAVDVTYALDKKDVKFAAGAEVNCILFPQNSVKAKIDNKLNFAVAYVAKLPGWTAAVSTTQDFKFGLNLVMDK